MGQTLTTSHPDPQSNAWLTNQPESLHMGSSAWQTMTSIELQLPHLALKSLSTKMGTHAVKGWYIGPALNAYRCYCTWFTETKCKRTADTLTWFPTTAPIPTLMSQDMIASATQDILATCTQQPCCQIPNSALNWQQSQNTKQIVSIIHNITIDAEPKNTTEETTKTPTLLRVPPAEAPTKPTPKTPHTCKKANTKNKPTNTNNKRAS